jgi:hypothetical protein
LAVYIACMRWSRSVEQVQAELPVLDSAWWVSVVDQSGDDGDGDA